MSTLISYFNDAKLNFSPVEEYAYSNSGYILLAAIIENIAKRPFGHYINDFFQRHGPTDTTFGPPVRQYALPTYGYLAEQKRNAEIIHPTWMAGAGGVHSTVRDLSKWIKYMHSDQFLSMKYRQAYLKGHARKHGGSYGYGWELLPDGDQTIMWHNGTTPGYVSYLGYQKASGRLLIILTNQTYARVSKIGLSEDHISRLQQAIWKLWKGDTVSTLPPKESLTEVHRSLIGQAFEFENEEKMYIRDSNGHLMACTDTGLPVVRIFFEQLLRGEEDHVRTLNKAADYLKGGKYWK